MDEKRKEEEERKKREEEERKRQEEEARKKKLEEALRRAEETGENVPNEDPNCRSWIKTYMGYQAVTNPRSYQYWLLNSQFAYTDPETGLRMYDDSGDGTDPRYCIAMGSFYTTTIGQKIDFNTVCFVSERIFNNWEKFFRLAVRNQTGNCSPAKAGII